MSDLDCVNWLNGEASKSARCNEKKYEELKPARERAAKLGVAYGPTIILFDRSEIEVIRSETWFEIFHTQSFFDHVYSDSFKRE